MPAAARTLHSTSCTSVRHRERKEGKREYVAGHRGKGLSQTISLVPVLTRVYQYSSILVTSLWRKIFRPQQKGEKEGRFGMSGVDVAIAGLFRDLSRGFNQQRGFLAGRKRGKEKAPADGWWPSIFAFSAAPGGREGGCGCGQCRIIGGAPDHDFRACPCRIPYLMRKRREEQEKK